MPAPLSVPGATGAGRQSRPQHEGQVCVRVLVVEDNPDHSELACTMLGLGQGAGAWRTERAVTLGEALRKLEADATDVILSDLTLPDSRGLETVRRLCAAHPGVALVVLTAADDDIAEEALQSGAQEFLRKGEFGPVVLRRTLRLALERKRAEAATARLAAIVDDSDDAIFELTLAGMVGSWNSGARRLYGYGPEEAVGQPFALLAPEGGPELARILDRLRAGERVVRTDTLMRRKDASVAGTALTVSTVYGAGQPIAFSVVARDVSERNRAEAELRDSRQRLKTILDREPECVKLVSPDGRLIEMNPAGLEMIEASGAASVMGRTVFDLVHPEDRARYRDFHRALCRGEARTLEFRLVGLRGTTRWVDSHAVPMRAEDGAVASILSVTRDVTARVETEKALEESERRHRALFENSPQPIWVYEAATLRFLAVNQAACRTYGYAAAEFLTMTVADLAPEGEPDPLPDDAGPPAAGEGPAHREVVRHRHRSGALLEVELSCQPITFGAAEAVLVVATDVTERRRLEAQLRHSQRLDAVGRLAGGVAHDFNNVLGVVIGYAELLRRSAPEGSRGRRQVDGILAAANRAADLTRRLLAFSRKQLLNPTALDLSAVVADMEPMLRQLVDERIEIELALDARLASTRADRVQLTQVVLNLVVNARDAMPGGGRLLIETANAELDESCRREDPTAQPGRYVMLAVTDTGAGMDAETLAHVFEPFFTTKSDGTGLGLATVYGIVRQSGGLVLVDSEPGRGTTCKVFLPAALERAGMESRAAGRRAAAGGRESVLLAEDDPLVRGVMCDVLSEAGYTIHAAADGREAARLASEVAFDLLLTDMVMPGLTGPELAGELSARGLAVPVLFVSGYTGDTIADHRPPAGSVLEKPFTPDALLRAVRQILDSRRT